MAADINVSPRYLTQDPYGRSGLRYTHPNAPCIAVVFVHGWWGHYRDTWTHRPAWWQRLLGRGTSARPLWEYLGEDPDFLFQYYSFSHKAGRAFAPFELRGIARALGTFLDQRVRPSADHLILIGHSIGGLICRQAILDTLNTRGARCDVDALLMIGTPNDGTTLGRLPWPSRILAQLLPGSDFLRELNREWVGRVVNGGNRAFKPEDRTDVFCRYMVGLRDRIVREGSTTTMAFIGDVGTYDDGHTPLTKPTDADDDPVVEAKSFLRKAKQHIENREVIRSAIILSSQLYNEIEQEDWFRTEHVTISLRASTREGILDVCQTAIREGVKCPGRYTIGVRVGDVTIPNEQAINYRFTIGRGVLSVEDYHEILKGLNANQLAKYVTATVEATHNGTQFAYALVAHEPSDGRYALLHFECPALLKQTQRVERLRIELRATMERRIGTYSYVTRQTITRHLRVDWSAPFTVECKPALGPEPDRRENQPLPEGNYGTTVQMPGPIRRGGRITFLFPE